MCCPEKRLPETALVGTAETYQTKKKPTIFGSFWIITVLVLSLVRVALHLEDFGHQFLGGDGLQSGAAEVLGGSSRQVGVGMHDDEGQIRILGELLVHLPNKCIGRIAVIHR